MHRVKSFFVLDALETADIATIRPSFRRRGREGVRAPEREKERASGI